MGSRRDETEFGTHEDSWDLADALGCQRCHLARHWTPGEVQLGRKIHGFEKNNLVPAKGKMLESRRPVEKILLKPRQDVPAV